MGTVEFHTTHKTNHYVVFLRRNLAMMKNFKLLCLFLVILFVSTEGAPRSQRLPPPRPRRPPPPRPPLLPPLLRGGSGGGRGGEGLSPTEVILIIVGISVVVIVISCVCYVCYACYSDNWKYDLQTLASSQIPQGNSANSPSQNIQMAVIP